MRLKGDTFYIPFRNRVYVVDLPGGWFVRVTEPSSWPSCLKPLCVFALFLPIVV